MGHRPADQPHASLRRADRDGRRHLCFGAWLLRHGLPDARRRRLATGRWHRSGHLSTIAFASAARGEPPAIRPARRAVHRARAARAATGGEPGSPRRAAGDCADRPRSAEAAVRGDCPPTRWEIGDCRVDRCAEIQPDTFSPGLPARSCRELLLAPRSRGESFSPADRQLLEDLGRQVGIAAHAVRLTADLRRARTRLVTAREEERRRLRRDLHDGLGPALSSVMLKLAAARHHLEADSAADAVVAEARTDLRVTLADVRRLVYELRPPALDQLGLVHAIHEQVERCRAVELRVHLETPERLPALPAAVEVAAFRITQEAVTNVVRHAEATTCSVQLAVEEAEPPHGTAVDNTWSSDHLRIEICDDGRGLPVDGRHGVGLVSMRERAEELGGTLWLGSGPAGGTRVVARLPLPPREVQV